MDQPEMPEDIQTQPGTALITGGARRIGRAIARFLAAHGWQIAIHYRRSDTDAQSLIDEIEKGGGRAVALAADLADPNQIAELVPLCRERLAAPTCLVNNASEFLLDTVTNLSGETWDTHLNINLKAPVFLAQALFLHLPQNATGNVINIIDQRVWRLTPDFFSYTISKAGLWTATRTLAQAMAPRVRVNAIGPGPVLKSIYQTQLDFEREVRATLLHRGPTPKEIAAAVHFILEAPAMTGQMIALDGGEHLNWSRSDSTPDG